MSHARTHNHHFRRDARIVVLNSPASSHSLSIGPAPSSSRASSRILFPHGCPLLVTQRPIKHNPRRYEFAHHRSLIINTITPKNIMDNPPNNPDDDRSPTKKKKKRGSSNISRKAKGGKKTHHIAGATTETFQGRGEAPLPVGTTGNILKMY